MNDTPDLPLGSPVEPRRYVRSKRGQALFDRDALDIEAARRMEAMAEERLLALDGATDRLEVELSRTGPPERTRGPRQEALRAVAGTMSKVSLYKTADDLLWSLVLRHDAIVRHDANVHARKASADPDDALQSVREGWFRAALRWEPSGGTTFPNYARQWGTAAWQRANDRQASVRAGRPRGGNGWTISPTESLDAPIGDHSFSELAVDCLADHEAEDPAERAAHDEEFAEVFEALSTLDLKRKTILELRYLHDQTLAFVGGVFGVSRERIRQLEGEAIVRVRDELGR